MRYVCGVTLVLCLAAGCGREPNAPAPPPPLPAPIQDAPKRFSAKNPQDALAWLVSVSKDVRGQFVNDFAKRAAEVEFYKKVDQLHGKDIAWLFPVRRVESAKGLARIHIEPCASPFSMKELRNRSALEPCVIFLLEVGMQIDVHLIWSDFTQDVEPWITKLSENDTVKVSGKIRTVTYNLDTFNNEFQIMHRFKVLLDDPVLTKD